MRVDGWTGERKVRFLEDLALRGNVRAAAGGVGMSHEAAYRLRRRDAMFAAGWDAALVSARRQAEQVLAARAIDGVVEDIYYRGDLVGTRVRHDARLLLAHLARLDRAAEVPFAEARADRFDELLALIGGAALPPELAPAPAPPPPRYGYVEDPDPLLPPTRERFLADAAEAAEREARERAEDEAWAREVGEAEEDESEYERLLREEQEAAEAAEIAAERAVQAAGAAARAAAAACWDGWTDTAAAATDALAGAAGEPPIEYKSLNPREPDPRPRAGGDLRRSSAFPPEVPASAGTQRAPRPRAGGGLRRSGAPHGSPAKAGVPGRCARPREVPASAGTQAGTRVDTAPTAFSPRTPCAPSTSPATCRPAAAAKSCGGRKILRNPPAGVAFNRQAGALPPQDPAPAAPATFFR